MEMRICDIVSSAYKQKGFNQKCLAAAIGVKQGNLSRMEHNNKYTLKTLCRIAEVLDMKLEINFKDKEK